MMEPHSSAGELEIVDFASTRTMYDPENRDAWLTIAWDYDKMAKKHERKYE